MKIPRLIASYPRSGNTWLRFILCNLYFPDVEHDFASVNRLIPAIEDAGNVLNAVADPYFYKTHALRCGESVIFLHRHVGDVLISEWWYKRKFHEDTRPLLEFIIATNFGENWRLSVDHYFPALEMIGYDDLDKPEAIHQLCPDFSLEQIQIAIGKSSFGKMQKVEEKGFGTYPPGDPKIKFFRSGVSGQWKFFGAETIELLYLKNGPQLKVLGYL